VWVGKGRLPCRLLALPVPQELAAKRRRRLKEIARRKQHNLSPLSLSTLAWTLYLTNVPSDYLTPQEVHILAFSRWPIERLFFLWKSSGLLDEWRSADLHRIWCELYAKLLAALIQHWLTVLSAWSHLDRSLWRVAQLIRKHAFHLALALPDTHALVCAITALIQAVSQTCHMHKRKAHPLTFQYWIEALNV